MKEPLNTIPNGLNLNIRKLFLIDGLGAFLTAFFLGVVLTQLEELFGMPKKVLYFLCALACFYAVFSICCFCFGDRRNMVPFLRLLVIANIIYCAITLTLVFSCYQKLTSLGILYFLLEIIIIGILTAIELTELVKINKKKR